MKNATQVADRVDFELLRRHMLLRITASLTLVFCGVYTCIWFWLGLQVLACFFIFASAFSLLIFFAKPLRIPHFLAAHSLVGVALVAVTLAGVYTWLQTSIALSYFPLVMLASTFIVQTKRVALMWLFADFVLMFSIHPIAIHFDLHGLPDEYVVEFNLANAAILLLATTALTFLFQSLSQRVIDSLTSVKNNLESTQKNLIDVQQYRNRFFTSISHEIRTPMNAVKGISELLSKNMDFMKKEGALVKALNTSSSHLLSLVNDLLDVSKLEVGEFKFAKADFDLHQCITEADTIVRYEATRKNLRYELQIEPSVPRYMHGDANRLRQVIVNLLSNAVKFTHQGSVTLTCSVIQHTNMRQPILKIDIADTGIGIDKAQQEKVFDAFIQGGDGISQKYGGTGLGLNISKRIVELQDGRIWLESELGVGTVFHIEMPIIVSERVASLTDETEALAALPSEPKACTVMLVEDNKINVLVAIRLITLHLPEAQVIEAENGARALELLNEGVIPDLVLMDLQMPVMGGLEATREIRRHPNPLVANLHIIAMTADAGRDDMDQCFAAGMNDFLSKPIDTKLLHMKLDNYLAKKKTV